jgi:hypothetical protein
MKNNNIFILVAAIIMSIALSGGGVRSYFKSAEKALKAQYQAQIDSNNVKLAYYAKLEAEYRARMKADSITIVQKTAEAAKLAGQNAKIKGDLVAAQSKIKNFTAGQAIEYFVAYSGATDSKMLVQDSDTGLVVSQPSVLKVDSIFNEHKFQKLEIINLKQIIAVKDGTIIAQSNYMLDCNKLVKNKEAEIELIKRNAALAAEQDKLKLDKMKAQRNRARGIVGGVSAVAVGILILSITGQ